MAPLKETERSGISDSVLTYIGIQNQTFKDYGDRIGFSRCSRSDLPLLPPPPL